MNFSLLALVIGSAIRSPDSGWPDVPLEWYVVLFFSGLLYVVCVQSWHYWVLRDFDRRYPLITAESLPAFRATFCPMKTKWQILFRIPMFTAVLLLLSWCSVVLLNALWAYNFNLLWPFTGILIALFWLLYRLDAESTRVQFFKPCAGRAVFEATRQIARQFGLQLKLPEVSDGDPVIAPADEESEYCHLLHHRIRKASAITLLQCILFPICFCPLFFASLFYVASQVPRAGVGHFFRPDGSLYEETAYFPRSSDDKRFLRQRYTIGFNENGEITHRIDQGQRAFFKRLQNGK